MLQQKGIIHLSSEAWMIFLWRARKATLTGQTRLGSVTFDLGRVITFDLGRGVLSADKRRERERERAGWTMS